MNSRSVEGSKGDSNDFKMNSRNMTDTKSNSNDKKMNPRIMTDAEKPPQYDVLYYVKGDDFFWPKKKRM